jgi:hypothetical protein
MMNLLVSEQKDLLQGPKNDEIRLSSLKLFTENV